MERYRVFLKRLLLLNMLFILVMAGFGFYESRGNNREGTLTSVSGEIKNRVIPVGQTVGIYVNTRGILVIDTGEVYDQQGNCYTPTKNKLLSGDYIISLNGTAINTKKELIDAITHCQGQPLIFGIRRNNKETEIKVIPVETEPDIYKVGIWVRDDLQGLGTITYVKGGKFGALGHSINDGDTGSVLEVSGGEIYAADIFGVEKGEVGNPGEIEGMITYQTENILGEIEGNQTYGIYGRINDAYTQILSNEKALEIASSKEVVCGRAYIQSYVSGERRLYEINITDIHTNKNGDSEIEIIVTDDNLIKLTGGIVQGMSGSPIIQNGKLIGAVTHVFVDEPTRGYGILMEYMLED